MKKSSLICFLFFVPFFAFAQSQLDSMYYGSDINYPQNVQYYQYDNQGRIIEELSQNRDLPITFQNRTRFEYLDNQIIETTEKWLINEQEWKFERQTVVEFDAFDRKIRDTKLYWVDVSNTFEVNDITNFEYDNQGNLIKEEIENRYEYSWTYNAQNQLTTYERILWNNDSSQMELFYTQTKSYDGNNLLISDIGQYHNGRVEEKYYTYDNKNRIHTTTEILMFQADTIYNDLTNHFYINATNLLDKTVTNGIETVYNYDKFGNLTEVKTGEVIMEYYVYSDNLFIEKHIFIGYGYTMELFSYDKNDDVKTYSYYLCDQFCGNGSNEHHKVYFRTNSSNSEATEEQINCLFPNPYTNYQQINCDELAPEKNYDLMVVNIAGQSIYETKFIGKNGFFINRQLDKGWYVFVVLDKGKIVTKQKILVF